jgi:hypothetical protein
VLHRARDGTRRACSAAVAGIGARDSIAPVRVPVESSRQEWEESHRRLSGAARDGAHYDRLLGQVDAVVAELRKRVGATFSLEQLAAAYARADRWSRDTVADAAELADDDWPRTAALVEGAAFHVYSRGAYDYEP